MFTRALTFFALSQLAVGNVWACQDIPINFGGSPLADMQNVGLHARLDPSRGWMLVAGGLEGSEVYFDKNGQPCIQFRKKKDGASQPAAGTTAGLTESAATDDDKPICGADFVKMEKDNEPNGISLGNQTDNLTDAQSKHSTAFLKLVKDESGKDSFVITPSDDQGNPKKDGGHIRIVQQTDGSFSNWDIQGYKGGGSSCDSIFAKLMLSQDKSGLSSSNSQTVKPRACSAVTFNGAPEIFADTKGITSSGGDSKAQIQNMCGQGQSIASQRGTPDSMGKATQ